MQGHYDHNCYHKHHTNNQHVPYDNNDGDDNYNVCNLKYGCCRDVIWLEF